jgi:hypothetical protein
MLAILILTLPTQPNAVRVRVWRALKTLGCGALRDGAYLLPSEHAVLFEPLAAEVREHGGSAMVLSLSPRDDAQRDELLALFDRTEAYAAWRDTVTALQSDLPALGETEARRRGRRPFASGSSSASSASAGRPGRSPSCTPSWWSAGAGSASGASCTRSTTAWCCPGPEAQQLATYIGWLMHRTWGGIVAGALFVLPSLFILIALSWVYMRFGDVPLVAGLSSTASSRR